LSNDTSRSSQTTDIVTKPALKMMNCSHQQTAQLPCNRESHVPLLLKYLPRIVNKSVVSGNCVRDIGDDTQLRENNDEIWLVSGLNEYRYFQNSPLGLEILVFLQSRKG
jgi:hypothetical protein